MWKLYLLCASCIAGLALAAALLGDVRTPLVEDGIEWATSRGDDEALSLAALAAKPTLSPLEVLAILNGSVSGVEP